MGGGTKCGLSNLSSTTREFLTKIREYLECECMGYVSIDDITEELNALTPTLRTVLSKWVPEITYILYVKGRAYFNELKKVLGISSRVLSDKLSTLEEVGIVTRNIDAKSKPPKVYYELTGFGREVALALIPVLVIIRDATYAKEGNALEK